MKPSKAQSSLILMGIARGYVQCVDYYPPLKVCLRNGWIVSGKVSGTLIVTDAGRQAVGCPPAGTGAT